MDWDTYKKLSHDPEYFTRWALDKTSHYVDDSIKSVLEAITQGTPLAKPIDHKGGIETDVFRINVVRAIALTIVDSLTQAATVEKIKGGSAQPNLSPLIRSWEEYVDSFS